MYFCLVSAIIDEARVKTVKKINSKFCILQPFEKVKITKFYREEPVLDL